jgi:hypothetical protein
MLFYQIRKIGQPVDKTSYPSFEQTCYEWEHDPAGREVVVADDDGNIAHTFTAQECREAALRFRNLKVV